MYEDVIWAGGKEQVEKKVLATESSETVGDGVMDAAEADVARSDAADVHTVSYTHLTLPTNREV